MAQKRSKLEASLFPFLNILFGLIAVLILHIFFIIQMSGVEGSVIGRTKSHGVAGESREVEQQLTERSRTLTDQINAAERQRRELEAGREQRELLLELRKSQDKIPSAGRGTAGVPIGAPVPKAWRMIPITTTGSDNSKNPILVEVCANAYIVHHFPGKGHTTTPLPVIPEPPQTKPGVEKAPLQAARALKAFLDGINLTRRKQYVLFLIRPEGIASFQRIQQYCLENYQTALSTKTAKKPALAQRFDIGYEPFSDWWIPVRQEPKQ